MLTKLRIKNFKSWQDTGEMRMAPLTMYFGANSSGKSSILQFLLMLKQTAESESNQVFSFNGIIDLGNFKDVIYGNKTKHNINFSITSLMRLGEQNISFFASVGEEKENLYIESVGGNNETINEDKRKNLFFQEYAKAVVEFKNLLSKLKEPVKPEHYYPSESHFLRRWKNFVSNHTFSIGYIGPLRELPQRHYQWKNSTPSDVGKKGEFSIQAIIASKINQKSNKNLEKNIGSALKKMGLVESFKVKPIAKNNRDYYQVWIKKTKGSTEVLLTDVGFGISQILPILTSLFYSPARSIIILEQPEIHLHPKAQAELADVIIEAINTRNIQVIIESHSEHLLGRLQRRIADGNFAKEKAALYFCEFLENDDKKTGASNLKELIIDDSGRIVNWPKDFFGNLLGEASSRVKAYLDQKRKQDEQ